MKKPVKPEEFLITASHVPLEQYQQSDAEAFPVSEKPANIINCHAQHAHIRL